MAMTTRKGFSNTYRENNVPSSKPPQRLTPQQLYARREKWLFSNCDNTHSNGHKCGEKKLFYIDCEEEELERRGIISRRGDFRINRRG